MSVARRPVPFGLTTLFAANLITIVIFVTQGGSILQALWVYWLQSIIIGVIHVLRILQFNLKPVSKTHSSILPNAATYTKGFMAMFFIFHYGMFHFVYAMFLFAFNPQAQAGSSLQFELGSAVNEAALMISGAAFAIHHLLSYIIEYRTRDTGTYSTVDDLKQVFGKPYSRILPMHLIIIFGPIIAGLFGNEMVFVVFMVLRTYLDVRLFRKGTSHPSYPQLQANHTA